MMGYHKKMFLLYGTIFAVVGLILDVIYAIRGDVDYYWWIDVIGAYAAAAIVAGASNCLSKRRVNKEKS